jgi:hypothetical protein
MRKIGWTLFAILVATPSMLGACGDDGPSTSPQVDGGSDSTSPADAGGDTSDPLDATPDGDAATPEPCSEDGFCHTKLPPAQTLRDVWGDASGVTWAVTEQGNILRWNGTAWSIHHSTHSELFAIWGSGPTDVWVGGAEGLFHGQGASSEALVWNRVDLPERDGVPIHSIWGRGADDVWAVGGRTDTSQSPPPVEGRAFHLGSGPNAPWTRETVHARDAVFTKVWGTEAGDVFVSGYDFERYPATSSDAVLVHRPPAETGFSEVVLPRIDRQGFPSTVDLMTGGGHVAGKIVLLTVAVDWATYVIGSAANDGGTELEWSDETFYPHAARRLRAVWGSAANDVWLAGDYGRLRHWDGTAWTFPRISVGQMPVIATFHAVWARAADDLWFVGDGIALHKRPANKN